MSHMTEGLDYFVEGEACGWDRQPMKSRSMIKRFWGWPTSAAKLAADELHGGIPHPGEDRARKIIWVEDDMRRLQQADLIRVVPAITPALLAGLAHGSTRERGVAGRPVASVVVRFSDSVPDDGIVSGILRAVANRLGASVSEVREAARFTGGVDGHVEIHVNTKAFEP